MTDASRILIVDDTESIHADFRKLLNCAVESATGIDQMEADLFGKAGGPCFGVDVSYEIDSAYQGDDSLAMIEKAEQEGRGYSVVFMDVRMPPGPDGIKTVQKIWERYPYIEVVVCTAYSDYSWEQMIERLGPSDHMLILKKPFDADELKQIALAMTCRADGRRRMESKLRGLKSSLAECEDSLARYRAGPAL